MPFRSALLALLLACPISTNIASAEPAAEPGGGRTTASGLLTPAAPSPQMQAGMPKAELSLYKTVTYTAVVLTTDQFWYVVAASQAITTSGWFGTANAVSSPILTYVFEYFWSDCCEPPPAEDGTIPVSPRKAAIYRVISTSRTALLALAFGNSLASTALVTGAITVTRTGAYVANDYVWGRIDARSPVGAASPPQIR